MRQERPAEGRAGRVLGIGAARAAGPATDTAARTAAAAGAVMLALAVAIGAFGTHALSGRLPAARLDTLDTAVRYQVIGGLGLLLVAALSQTPLGARGPLRVAAVLLLAGTGLFCAALYGLVAGGPPWLGAVAPLGGVLQIAAWSAVAVAFIRT